MTIDVYTGRDTVEIDGNLVNDGANGKVCEARFPNEVATLTKGKGGNTIITYNAEGDVCEVTVRVLTGGKTDQLLLQRYNQFINDSASFVAINAKFVKRVGDGTGATKKITLDLQKGVITKQPDAEEDASGDVEQAIAVYNIKFSNAVKTIS